MTYKALARKYRPQTFDEMVGQEAVVKTLKNALATGKIHPAYIFSGIRGVGKTTAARLFAKGLNCENGPTVTPCNTCPSCVEIAAGRSMDVLEIDGATHTKAEEARDLMQAARYMPVRDRYRVFIIDEVHMLSTAAFNALLKTLEEPPAHAIFLLATTEPFRIPETIHSRAQHFQFRRVSAHKVASFLKDLCGREGVEAEPAALDLVARSGEGSVRDSLTLLDRLLTYANGPLGEAEAVEVLGVVGRDALLSMLDIISRGEPSGVSRFLDEARDRGQNLERFLSDLVALVRDVLRYKTAGTGVDAEEAADDGGLKAAAERLSLEDLLRLWDLLALTQQRLKGAPDPEALLELQLIKAALLPGILPLEQVLSGARLPDGPDGAGPDRPGPGPGSESTGKAEGQQGGGGGPETGAGDDLRFKALIPFKRMDELEARSYEGDERLDHFRKAVSQKMPLLAPSLESAALSLDPDGVLHLVLPHGATTAAALLESAERMKALESTAREIGFSGRLQVENGEPAPDSPVPESELADRDEAGSSPAVKVVLRLLGGSVVKVTPLSAAEADVEPPAGGEDAEPE